jgi:DNA recombination protein RmuC
MFDLASSLIGLAIGALFAGLIGWLAARARFRSDPRVEADLRQQLTQREGDKAELSNRLAAAGAECAAARERENAANTRAGELQVQVREGESQLLALQSKLQEMQSELAALRAQANAGQQAAERQARELEALKLRFQASQDEVMNLKGANGKLQEQSRFLQERLDTERAQLEALQQKFHKEFEAVANKLLVDNSAKFGQQSAESLDKLLAPLRENLKDFKGRLEGVQNATLEQNALLKDQVHRIGAEAANLSKALKGDVKVLGNWGENMLDQILEKSGLQPEIHYRRQVAEREDGGSTRILDVVINLPEGKHLVIDSKVSLKAYEEHINCEDEKIRAERLQAHVDSVRAHFRGLGAKRYQDLLGINAPDFVLMYIPVEAAFFSAIGQEPGLFSEALDRNVVLTTNSTLLATLRTVAHVWRLADQRKNALEIADRGGKLYDKFVGFVEDLEAVRKTFGSSQESLEAAFKKLHTGQGNLVSQADRLKALGVKAAKSLPSALVEQAEDVPVSLERGNGKDLLTGPTTSI